MNFIKHMLETLLIINLARFSLQECQTNGREENVKLNCSGGVYGYCTEEKTFVTFTLNCQNDELTSIHTDKSYATIHEIVFTGTTSPRISSGIFDKFPNTRYLVIDNSKVAGVDPGAFEGLNDLYYLTLNKNNISTLSKGVFNSSAMLQSLDLSDNLIDTIEDNSFLGMKSLETLSFRNNHIDNINEILNVGGELVILDLSHNKISDLISFENFTLLSNLYLNNNRLKYLKNNIFSNTHISNLDLSSNLIQHIEGGAFRNMSELRILNIASNQLSTLPVGLFQDTLELQVLNMSRTGLNAIAVGTFTELRYLLTLDLSSNNLTYLAKGVFHDLDSIKTLYMNDNNLTYFPYTFLKGLQTIKLSNNLWNCDFLHDVTLKLNTTRIVRGTVLNTTNIYGIQCSEIRNGEEQRKVNDQDISETKKNQPCEVEEDRQLIWNRTVQENRASLQKVRSDMEKFYKDFSKNVSLTMKTTCLGITYNSTSLIEESEKKFRLIKKELERINQREEAREELRNTLEEPQKLKASIDDDKDTKQNVILLCILIVLILILLILMALMYLLAKVRAISEFKKMQVPLLENERL